MLSVFNLYKVVFLKVLTSHHKMYLHIRYLPPLKNATTKIMLKMFLLIKYLLSLKNALVHISSWTKSRLMY